MLWQELQPLQIYFSVNIPSIYLYAFVLVFDWELSSYQPKCFKIDDHMGIGIAGLVADARVLAKYMRTECINHRYTYDAPMQVGRPVLQVADKSQLGVDITCEHGVHLTQGLLQQLVVQQAGDGTVGVFTLRALRCGHSEVAKVSGVQPSDSRRAALGARHHGLVW